MVTNYPAQKFDVIVVGAGHAGCEAALAAARLNCKTLLITINLDMVAFMPCNPSIGGPAKGVVVREIDALGGEMGKNIDQTYLQMRMLNTGKGPAVRALRAQADKNAYHAEMKKTIEKEPNLILRQGMVEKLLIKNKKVIGVETTTKTIFHAAAVVLTTGTALRGKIIIGDLKYSSGPNNSLSSIGLADNLCELGFDIARFKTGTPPRVKAQTIDYQKTEIQPGDPTPNHFSFSSKDQDYLSEQKPCWLTYTNEKSHDLIRQNLHRAPMFTGIVEGVGARYCPSIEDKIVRFADVARHQLFLEPEGEATSEIYVQGLSTSLPEDIQLSLLHTIAGLKNVELMRPGYAIEYDVVKPYQLENTLETKLISGLFTAGQMNGTSGYEEAAGQGIIAGINAALKVQGKKPFSLGRDEAYIGVLIDDLVTKGTNEPYRLLTSRAEFRLILRHDNADLRLTEKGREIGLVEDEQYLRFATKNKRIKNELKRLEKEKLKPTDEVNEKIVKMGYQPLQDAMSASAFLKRSEISYDHLLQFIGGASENITNREVEQIEITLKYEGYIKKVIEQIKKLKKMESKKIPANIDYQAINSLATEAREKLKKIKPTTIAQASRISGVNPVDINILMVYLKNKR